MASEVSQLSEMHAVLIASKTDNERRAQEAEQQAAKIAELEKQLEEQVAFTNRYRTVKTSATGGLRKRAETLQDLFFKVDHVAKQISDVYVSRLSVTAKAELPVEGVQDQEAVATQESLDLTATFERLARLDGQQRQSTNNKQDIKTRNFPGENRAKENELQELADRISELEVQLISQEDDDAAAGAARAESLEATDALGSELAILKQRQKTAVSDLEQRVCEMSEIKTGNAEVGRAWNGDMAQIVADKQSTAVDTKALDQRLAALFDDTTRQEQLFTLEERQGRLAETGPRLSMEMEEVQRQGKQDDAKVVEMRTQLHGSTQRRQLLTDQLAAAGKAIAAHSIKEPDFGKRKAEHEILASKIAALRTTQANLETRKAILGEGHRLASEEFASATAATRAEITRLNEANNGIVAEREAAAAALTPMQFNAIRARTELASLQGKSEEASTALQDVSGLEQECQNQLNADHNDHDRACSQYQSEILKQQVEIQSIERRAEREEDDVKTTRVTVQSEHHRLVEAAKHELFTEALARRTAALAADMDTANVEELKGVQEQIVVEDTRLRAACTDANQCPPGGTEERLQMELSDLLAQRTAMLSNVSLAEARVQRLKDTIEGKPEVAP